MSSPPLVVDDNLECPVCYQVLCEPVKAPACAHVYCRNCLIQAQTVRPVCPICRADASTPAESLEACLAVPEADLRAKDAQYDERAERQREERGELVRKRAESEVRRAAHDTGSESLAVEARLVRLLEAATRFEVLGAGVPEVNGEYTVSILPGYFGPLVFTKPNSPFFVYRWERRHWVIADVSAGMLGDPSTWIYVAAVPQRVSGVPPERGWRVGQGARARTNSSVAPTVRVDSPAGQGAVVGGESYNQNHTLVVALVATALGSLGGEVLADMSPRAREQPAVPQPRPRPQPGHPSEGGEGAARSGSRGPAQRAPRCVLM